MSLSAPVRRALLAAAILADGPLCLLAQTHKVAKPEDVVRAVGVYEWTGDMAKPAAMRLVPVTLYIDKKFEEAGVYLARPMPFALETGVVYEVQDGGVPKGTIELRFTRRFEPTDTAKATPYDDGWFGYGRFVPPMAPKKSTLKPSKNLAVIDTGDDTRPHFSTKSATPGSGGSAAGGSGSSGSSSGAPAADPDRPTMKRHSDSSDKSSSSSSSGSSGDGGSTPPDDPDRPTMKRHTDSSSSSSSDDIADPDRPTLRRRSPDQAAAAKGPATNGEAPGLNDDPNRPKLVRGKPANLATPDDLPKLAGLPAEQDLHQMVAVSDASNRPVHDFSRAWDDPSDKTAILSKMETAAQKELAAYAAANAPAGAASTAPPPGDARHPNSKLRRGVTPDTKAAAPPPQTLQDEQLKAFTLTYGAPATYVYTAHTDGTGPALRYVTLIAEVDMQGNPQVVFKSVTDASHLDRTPRMRLIDAVDPDASNRASLLFEMREQNDRQFALYRIYGANADQIFLTGTTR